MFATRIAWLGVVPVLLGGCTGGCAGDGLELDTHAPPAASACAEGEVDDGGTCVPEACGTGPWGDAVPDDGAVVYVDPSADAPSPDGSEAAPFPTIQGAFDAAERDATVVVAAGTYAEVLTLARRHRLAAVIGRCAAMVSVDGTDADADPDGDGNPSPGLLIDIGDDAAVTFTDLTFANGPQIGIFVQSGITTMARLDLVGSNAAGLLAAYGSVSTFSDGQIREGQSDSDGQYGHGVEVNEGGTLTLTDTTIADNPNGGILALGADTHVTLERVTVTGTRASRRGDGLAVDVTDGATLTATDVTIDDFESMGILVSGADARATFVTSSISGGAAYAATAGWGAQVELGGRLDTTDTWFDDNARTAIGVFDAGSHLEMLRGGVRRTVGSEADTIGIGVADDATATLTDAEVSGGEGYGVHVEGSLASVVLDGVTIADVAAPVLGEAGVGLMADDGGTVTATDLTVSGCALGGVQAAGAGTRLTITGGTVSGIGPAGQEARAVAVAGGTLVATDVTVADNTGNGLYVDEGAVVTWTGGAITGTVPRDSGLGGRGVEVYGGSAATLTGVRIAENADTSVLIWGVGSRGTLIGGEVVDTRRSETTLTGRGLTVEEGASLRVEGGTLVSGHQGAGIVAFDHGTTLSLDDVTVRDVGADLLTLWGMGVVIQEGPTFDAVGLTVEGTSGPGLYMVYGGVGVCDACRFDGGAWATVIVLEGALELRNSTITGGADVLTALVAGGDYGDPTLTVTDTDVSGGEFAVAWLEGPGAFTLGGGTYDASEAEPGATIHGNAVFGAYVDAWDGTTGLRLVGTTLRGAAGPAVLLHAASATLTDVVYTDNAAESVWQQACDDVTTPPPGAPVEDSEICPDEWGLIDWTEWRVATL